MDLKCFCCENFVCNYAFKHVYDKLNSIQKNECKLTLNTMVVHCHVVECIIYYLFDNTCVYNINSIVDYICKDDSLLDDVLSYILQNHSHYLNKLCKYDTFINESIERMYNHDKNYCDVLINSKIPSKLKQKVNYDIKLLTELSCLQLKCELMYRVFSKLCELRKQHYTSKYFLKNSLNMKNSFNYLLSFLREHNRQKLYMQQIHKVKPYFDIEKIETYTLKMMLDYSTETENELTHKLNFIFNTVNDEYIINLINVCMHSSEKRKSELLEYKKMADECELEEIIKP